MSEPEERDLEPDLMAFVEYQLVRLDGLVIVDFNAPLGHAIYWEPDLGMEIVGPVAGRYRVLPGGPWIVRAYYPDGYPGRQGPWPEGAELPNQTPALG